MLYRQEKQGKIAITQPTHTWLSGQWHAPPGNERFGEVVPWEEVRLGAAQHDAGPMLNPQAGLPSSFLEMLMQIGSHLFIVTPVNELSIASAFQRLVTPLYSASL
jgi:Protein of unknown function (DUF3891)